MEDSACIEPMLTASDVARIMHVHINTVRRWSNQGSLKTYYIGSRCDRRYYREDLYHFIRQKSKKMGKAGFQESAILSN